MESTNIVADMAVDLLCTLTFEPAGGHDPEDIADLQRNWWQTLIHDLSVDEARQIAAAVRRQVDDLRSPSRQPLAPHLAIRLKTLESYLRGKLR